MRKFLKEKDLIGISVHGMASCKMGESREQALLTSGQVWGHQNLYVLILQYCLTMVNHHKAF